MSGDSTTLPSKLAFEKAEKEGWKILTPKPNELFIDIDSAADLEAFQKNVAIFDELVMTVVGKTVTPSKSGDPSRRHVIVTLSKDVTETERLLFQLMLGSDRKRELLGYARVLAEDPIPTLFFEKAEQSNATRAALDGKSGAA